MANLCIKLSFCFLHSIGQELDWDIIIKNIDSDSVLSSEYVKYGSNVALILLGATSLLLALIHWKISIVPLYSQDITDIDEEADETKEEIELEEQ